MESTSNTPIKRLFIDLSVKVLKQKFKKDIARIVEPSLSTRSLLVRWLFSFVLEYVLTKWAKYFRTVNVQPVQEIQINNNETRI